MPKRYSKPRRRSERELRRAITGGVWAIASVSDEPEVVLSDWHIFEVQLPSNSTRTRHFAGCTGRHRSGQVSSAIQEFDPKALRGVTASGRVYQLTRHRGFTLDGEYTWNRWCGISAAADIVDVSAEVWAHIPQPTEAEVAARKVAFEVRRTEARAKVDAMVAGRPRAKFEPGDFGAQTFKEDDA